MHDTKKIEKLAREIYKWCMKHDLWGDNCIYFNGKAWSSSKEWDDEKGKKIDDRLYEYENRDPKTYFEWVADPNILSMSFEGALNHVLNGYILGSDYLSNQLSNIFNRYGYYYEMGDSWNFTIAEI